MAEALYRKYRSKKLDEVVGQEHITTTLKNALKTGKISHAYLFTGPKGVGKTSIARILAHEVNDLPYKKEGHLDIIEIDAASNRRIDEIRDLRDKVHIAPTSAKYKVYIIDEVHMLTKEAFNALLKTLEEPPEHVIFILATTEAHKLPETIISRTQRYSFKAINKTNIAEHLEHLAKQEGAKVDKDALNLIAAHSQGSLRDAISLLDQLLARSSTVSVHDVEHTLGIAPEESVAQLTSLLESGTPKDIVSFLQQLDEQGVSPAQVAHQISESLRSQLLSDTSSGLDIIELLEKLLSVPSTTNPKQQLELILLEQAIKHSNPSQITEKEQPAEVLDELVVDTTEPEPVIINNKPIQTTELASIGTPEGWANILEAIKQRHNTLYGVIRMAQPELKGETLTLRFSFEFHQKRMNEPKNKQVIADVIAQTTGKNIVIECIVDKKAPIEKQTVNNSATLETITDIFGGGEVLES